MSLPPIHQIYVIRGAYIRAKEEKIEENGGRFREKMNSELKEKRLKHVCLEFAKNDLKIIQT